MPTSNPLSWSSGHLVTWSCGLTRPRWVWQWLPTLVYLRTHLHNRIVRWVLHFIARNLQYGSRQEGKDNYHHQERPPDKYAARGSATGGGGREGRAQGVVNGFMDCSKVVQLCKVFSIGLHAVCVFVCVCMRVCTQCVNCMHSVHYSVRVWGMCVYCCTV